jgi:hypothetical protein
MSKLIARNQWRIAVVVEAVLCALFAWLLVARTGAGGAAALGVWLEISVVMTLVTVGTSLLIRRTMSPKWEEKATMIASVIAGALLGMASAWLTMSLAGGPVGI